MHSVLQVIAAELVFSPLGGHHRLVYIVGRLSDHALEVE